MSIIIAATITPDLKKWLDEKSEKDDRTVSRIVRRILQEKMNSEKSTEKEIFDIPSSNNENNQGKL